MYVQNSFVDEDLGGRNVVLLQFTVLREMLYINSDTTDAVTFRIHYYIV